MQSEHILYALLLAGMLVVGGVYVWNWWKELPIRVVVVGEGPRAYREVEEIALGATGKHWKLVGWVLDSNREAANRYQAIAAGHFPNDRAECLRLAKQLGVPVWDGPIYGSGFRTWFRSLGKVHLVLMAGFGWKVRLHQIDWVSGWWLNTHPAPKWATPSEYVWPNKYRGAQPYQGMLRDGVKEVGIVLHAIDEHWDAGTYFTQSEAVPMWDEAELPETQAEVADVLRLMHQRTTKPAVEMIRQLAPEIKRAIRSWRSPTWFARRLEAERVAGSFSSAC